MIFLAIFLIGNFIAQKLNIYLQHYHNVLDINKLPIIGESNVNILLNKINVFVDKLFNADFFKKSAVYTTDGILTYFVSIMSVYFILVDKYDIVNLAEKLFTKNKVHILMKKFSDIKSLLRVETFLVLITTIQTIIGFFVLGIEDCFMLGIICGILDILPYVGTIIIFIPLIIYKMYEKNYVTIFGLIALYIFLQVSRQIMETNFMSSKLKIHPLIILISVYIGIKAFGIIGLFIAPIYVITAKEIILSS
ncbi:putative PurR-regulated permease PerM [Clostridium acetobutylicum]|nr:putative PurR-regulated permease PerM [Clostridium acetobutylicum]